MFYKLDFNLNDLFGVLLIRFAAKGKPMFYFKFLQVDFLVLG